MKDRTVWLDYFKIQSENCMWSWRLVIWSSTCSHSLIITSFKESQSIVKSFGFRFIKPNNCCDSIVRISDLKCFSIRVKKVIDIFVVNLEVGHSHPDSVLKMAPSLVDISNAFLDKSWLNYRSWHRICFSRRSLSVSHNCHIETLEGLVD